MHFVELINKGDSSWYGIDIYHHSFLNDSLALFQSADDPVVLSASSFRWNRESDAFSLRRSSSLFTWTISFLPLNSILVTQNAIWLMTITQNAIWLMTITQSQILRYYLLLLNLKWIILVVFGNTSLKNEHSLDKVLNSTPFLDDPPIATKISENYYCQLYFLVLISAIFLCQNFIIDSKLNHFLAPKSSYYMNIPLQNLWNLWNQYSTPYFRVDFNSRHLREYIYINIWRLFIAPPTVSSQ